MINYLFMMYFSKCFPKKKFYYFTIDLIQTKELVNMLLGFFRNGNGLMQHVHSQTNENPFIHDVCLKGFLKRVM